MGGTRNTVDSDEVAGYIRTIHKLDAERFAAVNRTVELERQAAQFVIGSRATEEWVATLEARLQAAEERVTELQSVEEDNDRLAHLLRLRDMRIEAAEKALREARSYVVAANANLQGHHSAVGEDAVMQGITDSVLATIDAWLPSVEHSRDACPVAWAGGCPKCAPPPAENGDS